MSNMSYCRFRNTVRDLMDCVESAREDGLADLSEEERAAADEMYILCVDFIDCYEAEE